MQPNKHKSAANMDDWLHCIYRCSDFIAFDQEIIEN